MKKNKNDLSKYLEKEFLNILFKTKVLQDIYDTANQLYDIPRSISSDFVTLRCSLNEASEFILFCLTDSYEKVKNNGKSYNSILNQYYTTNEIKFYSNSKFEQNKIKFPLKFNMVQINNNQWIGTINIKTMMQLRDAQLINYNINAQRTMQRIVKGNDEVYKITINHKAINAIEDLFKKEIYIPTPFTLNIPEDTLSDFYYDKEKSELVINSIEHFDISDGYHRYLAACKIYDLDKEFDYTMELRIVNWSDDKAKQFIYQEDQKTKMKKIDSDSLNMYNPANIVAEKLNESHKCYLQGKILRNGGIINLSDFSIVINGIYFKDKKEDDKLIIINTVKELTDGLNSIIEYDSKYLTEKYTFKEIVAITYLIHVYKNDTQSMCSILNTFIENVYNIDNRRFINKKICKPLLNDLEGALKEVY